MSFRAGNTIVPWQLRHSAALLDPLLTSMPSAAVVVDDEHRIVLASDAFAARTGTSTGSLIGRMACEIFTFRKKPTLACQRCKQPTAFCEIADRVFATPNPLRAQAQLANERGATVTVAVCATRLNFEGRPHALIVLDEEAAVSPFVGHQRQPAAQYGFIGCHPKMFELFDTIERVARMKLPVLIQGESGTGKEMVATALHERSGRTGPLVPVNSGALPEGLLESELFGHVRGAFTGAVRDKRGRFELAHHGTLFLDEIGEISAAMQVKLLRAVQEGTFERVGGEQTLKVDVRVICATNRDVEKDVASGRFRADLFYRISVVPITLPALRDRASDIPLLVRHFLERASAAAGMGMPELPDETMSVLTDYRWPGNIRELANIVERLAILHAGGDVDERHVVAVLPMDGGVRRPEEPLPDPAAMDNSLTDTLDSHERTLIVRALSVAGGNVAEAARRLKTQRANLYRRMRRLGIPVGDE